MSEMAHAPDTSSALEVIMRVVKSWARVVIASCLVVSPLTAQSAQRFSIQVSGLYAGLSGGDYEGPQITDGIGAEGQLRYNPGIFSVGAGYQYTLHSRAAHTESSGDFEFNFREWDITLSGFFVEPRFVIPVGGSMFAPYVSGRFSMLRYKWDTDWTETSSGTTGTASISTNGMTINGGGGVLVRMGHRVNLDMGVTYGYSTFDDYTIRVAIPGSGVSDGATEPAGSGSNIVARIGLAIGLGG